MTKNKSKQSSESNEPCKWCKKSFRNEQTLITHLCPKKRRWVDRDVTHIRLAFRTFQIFYEKQTGATKPKTMEEFINSSFYIGFVKFGRSCLVNDYLYPEKFAEWVIASGKKLTEWAKDATYDEYLLSFIKQEPGLRAFERTIIYLGEWAEENDCKLQDYFLKVSGSRAAYDIRSAKISPWVLYLSTTGPELLSRINVEQVAMINDIIDAKFWLAVFAKNAADVDLIESICQESGI